MENVNPYMQEKKSHMLRNVLIALTVVGVGILAYLGFQSPELFRASIIGGSEDSSVTEDLYISKDYIADTESSSGLVAIRAGRDFTDITELKLTFSSSSTLISWLGVVDTGTTMDGINLVQFVDQGNTLTVDYGSGFNTGAVSKNDVLFNLSVQLTPAVPEGGTVVIDLVQNVSVTSMDEGSGVFAPTFSSGLITYSTTSACENVDCGQYGACDDNTGQCTCNTGYANPSCGQCDVGYSGFPNCVLDSLIDLDRLFLSLDQQTVANMTQAERDQAFSSVTLMINSSGAAGHTITLEGDTVSIVGPATYIDEQQAIQEMVSTGLQPLATTLAAVPGVQVAVDPSVDGVLVLTPTGTNTAIDISTTAQFGDVSVLPGMATGLTLTNFDSSLGMQVVGRFDDGITIDTQQLNPADVTWVAQPAERLDTPVLDGGRLEPGNRSGTATVYAEVTKADSSVIRSNAVDVTVPCAVGFPDFPGCQLDEYANLNALTISLDQVTINNLNTVESEEVFASAAIVVNSSAVAGQSITLEGTTLQLSLPAGTYVDELARITAMVGDLATQLTTVTSVNVTQHPLLPGVLVLLPNGTNTNNAIDISTTDQSGALAILPSMSNGVTVHPTTSFGMQVIGEFTDGTTKSIDLADVSWTADTPNRIDDLTLRTGRLEAGPLTGNTNVFAELTKEDGSVVRSNTVTAMVPCEVGHGDYPNCELSNLNNLDSMILSLDQVTVNSMGVTQREEVFTSAILVVNSPQIVGQSVTLEGQTFPITLPVGTYNTDLERVEAIADDLETQFAAVTDVTVTESPTNPGILVLRPTAANANGAIDIATTDQVGNLAILPSISAGLTLNPNASLGMQVIGTFNDGSTESLDLTDVTWLSNPVNRVNDAALDAGRLEPGDTAGTTDVFVQFTKPDGTLVNSNTITVTIPSGPNIEFARLIGSGPISRGDQIELSVKVNDVNQIGNIQDIRTSIVRTVFTEYDEINLDPNAIFFTTTPFSPSQINGVNNTAQDGGDGSSFFRIYRIPVSIPQDNNLTDGAYQLLLEITDIQGNTTAKAIPITVGATASGDVNGDGQVSMIDVILSFQFVTGSQTPTAAQRISADIDGSGDITMIDVILLFNQVSL